MVATTISPPVAPTLYSLEIAGSACSDLPYDVELRESWGAHDLVFLRIPVAPGTPYKHLLTAWADNAPVKMVWGRGSVNMSTWYGYVNHHEVASNDDAGMGTIQITYVCIGTSKPMNTEVSKAWPITTPTAIAQTIARKYSLRCVVTSTNFNLPFEMQVESDFSFLNRIAAKVGYRFWVSGGTLYMIDPLVLLSGISMYYIPHYTIDNIAGQVDCAQKFKVLQGVGIPGSLQMNRKVYGVDARGVYSATADGDTYQDDDVEIYRHVASRGEAKNIMNAKKSLAQFWLQATVEVMGYSVLYPGKVIKLLGQALTNGTAGDWIVTDADHILKPTGLIPSDDKYVTRLSVIRNAQNSTLSVKSVQKVVPEFVTCRLQANQWVAMNMATITEGIV